MKKTLFFEFYEPDIFSISFRIDEKIQFTSFLLLKGDRYFRLDEI